MSDKFFQDNPTRPTLMNLKDFEKESKRQKSSSVDRTEPYVTHEECVNYIYYLRQSGFDNVHYSSRHSEMIETLRKFLKQRNLTQYQFM